MVDYILWFLGIGLLLFAAVCVVGFVLVRFLFIRIAERISVRMAPPIKTAATSEAAAAYLKRMDQMERLMDRVIPLPLVGGIGVDALIGLIPYVGDAASAAVTASIILKSLQFGLPKELVARMVTNMFIDLLVGSVPVLGDVFDVVFKANTRNMALLRAHLERVRVETRYNRAPQRLQ